MDDCFAFYFPLSYKCFDFLVKKERFYFLGQRDLPIASLGKLRFAVSDGEF